MDGKMVALWRGIRMGYDRFAYDGRPFVWIGPYYRFGKEYLLCRSIRGNNVRFFRPSTIVSFL